MEIVVCVKRVPDVAEADLAIDRTGRGVVETDLVFGTNEWDDFAVEEALRQREAHGGRVRVVTLGDDAAEDVLRRALAMGADEAVHLGDPAFAGGDAYATAAALAREIASRPCDLVLTGAVAGDTGAGQVGGMIAALLGVPQVALVTGLTVTGGKALVRHEVEGGVEREVEVDLPAVLTVQTGLNEPRYVSIRGIRKVAGVAIPKKSAADLGLAAAKAGEAGSRVRLSAMFLPPAGTGAEMLTGSPEEMADALAARLRQRGGL